MREVLNALLDSGTQVSQDDLVSVLLRRVRVLIDDEHEYERLSAEIRAHRAQLRAGRAG